jgi:hypothetical protein
VAARYLPEYPKRMFYLALLGLTLTQIAQVFGVGVNVIVEWKKKYPDFDRAYKEGGRRADGKVAHSLYKAAVGYKYIDKVVMMKKVKEFDEKGKVISETTEPLIVEVEKEMPINVTAAIKWLSARHPQIWNERIQIDAKLKVDHNLDLRDFSTQELEMLNKIGLNHAKENKVEDTEYEEAG